MTADDPRGRDDRQDNLRPEPENQASAMPPPDDVIELGPPGDSTAGDSADTGAGTGGATESAGPTPHDEATHLGNRSNG